MKSALVVAAVLVAVSSFPLRSQQPATQPPQSPPSATQRPAPAPPPEAQATAPAATDLQPVSGKLESKLDSKTAKTGDSIVVKTETTVKMADGTVIPKGLKLVGRVIGVQAQGEASQNSQVAIQFDHAEVNGGQTVPIQTVIKSVGQTDTGSASSVPDAAPISPSPNAPSAPAGGTQGSTPSAGSSGQTQESNATPRTSQPPGNSASSSSSTPAPGTIVARSGNIAIRTTSIPGVLIANNDQGQDPRMAKSSGILLGAQRNIELGSGTPMQLTIADTAAH